MDTKSIKLIAAGDYERLKETIELLSANPKLADELKKEKKRMKDGQFITLADFKKKYECKSSQSK